MQQHALRCGLSLLGIDTSELKELVPLRILNQVLCELLLETDAELIALAITSGAILPDRIHNSQTGGDGVKGETEGVGCSKAKVGVTGRRISPIRWDVAHGREAVSAKEEARVVADRGNSSESCADCVLRDAVCELADVPRLRCPC